MFKKIKLWTAAFFGIKKEVIKEEEEKKPVATNHAKERLEERHGEILSDEMIASIVSDIKSKKAEFLKDTRNNTQAWVATYKNKKYRVIYSCETEVLVTIYRNIKGKFVKPNRRKRNKLQKRLHTYDASYKKREMKFKKPYKRNKKVDYEEYKDMI